MIPEQHASHLVCLAREYLGDEIAAQRRGRVGPLRTSVRTSLLARGPVVAVLGQNRVFVRGRVVASLRCPVGLPRHKALVRNGQPTHAFGAVRAHVTVGIACLKVHGRLGGLLERAHRLRHLDGAARLLAPLDIGVSAQLAAGDDRVEDGSLERLGLGH